MPLCVGNTQVPAGHHHREHVRELWERRLGLDDSLCLHRLEQLLPGPGAVAFGEQLQGPLGRLQLHLEGRVSEQFLRFRRPVSFPERVIRCEPAFRSSFQEAVLKNRRVLAAGDLALPLHQSLDLGQTRLLRHGAADGVSLPLLPVTVNEDAAKHKADNFEFL